MNRSDQAGDETSETGRAVSKQSCGGLDIDILSDNGDEYCECHDQNIRPCSRDFYSEEEFEDAEAEQVPGSRSSHQLGGTGQASTSLPKVTGGSLEDGEGRSRQEDTEAQSGMTSRHVSEFTEQVPLRTDGEAPPATRHRSHSRIPVPAGKTLISPRTAGEKGSKTELSSQMEAEGKEHFSSLRSTQETTFKVAAKSNDFGGRGLSSAGEMPRDARQEVNCDKPSKQFLTLSESRRHEESTSDLELSRVTRSSDVGDLKYLMEPGELSAFYGAAQSEYVVMTLAEERHLNRQKSETQRKVDLGKPLSSASGRTAGKAGRRQMSRGGAISKERSRGELTSSARLNAIIRDRSRLALMKEHEPLSRDSSNLQSGRMSADKEQERPFQRNRLQAIREEKAQIRQRMSATKPLSPGKSRKLLSTPTIKQALTSTIGTTSLKKEMLQRRSAIERMSKEIEASRTTAPQAPTSKMVKTETEKKDVQLMKDENGGKKNEITDSANQVDKIKLGSKDGVSCYPDREDDHQDITESVNKLQEGRAGQMKQRMRIPDKVPHYSRAPRTPGELTNRGEAKAELCSLSARYQARLKKYHDQKADINRIQRELCKTVTTLNELRSRIVGLAGDDPGELEAPELLSDRPPSSQIHTPTCRDPQHLAEGTSTTVTGTNTEPQEERTHLRILHLENEKVELLSETEKIKKENEYLKKLEKEQKERESELRRELSSALVGLKEYEKRVRELELKLADRGNSISQLRGNIAKLQDLPEKLKQKEEQIASLRRRLSEESKEHNLQIKSVLETKEALHHDMQKERENFQRQLKTIQEENNSLKAQLDQTSEKIAYLEQKQFELDSQLEREMKKNHDLHKMLMSRENDLVTLERKLEETENSSCNIIGLSEQLMQKDSIISELEKHRANIQSQNRDMYSLLSSVFTIFGKEVNEKEIETSLTTGRIKSLSDMLTNLVNKKICENTKDNRNSEEYEKEILQLENKVAVLQAELEESKNYSETLAGVISEGNPWETYEQTENGEKRKYPSEVDGSEGDHPSKLIEDKCNGAPCILRSPTIGLIKRNNLTEGSIQELFVLLEGKRQALLRMERKMRELEEIHANCAQKRVRNEIRIDQLEMMLAMYKE